MATPVISSLSVQSGPASGDTTVNIVGSNFEAGALVYFGDKLAADIVVTPTANITCKSPAVDGFRTEDVYVQNPGGERSEVSPKSKFYYFSNLGSPNIQNVNPYFDPNSNYTFYGSVAFAKDPFFASAPIAPTNPGSPTNKPPAGYYYLAVNEDGDMVKVSPL